MSKVIIAVRLRGRVNIERDREETLKRLRLTRVNHAVLLDDRPDYIGMLKSVKDHITWGEIEEKTLESLLKKRAKASAKKRAEGKKAPSFKETAKKMLKEDKTLKTLGFKPVLRLNPPSKGFEKGGIKKGYSVGGALGYRAHDINALIKRMM